MTKTLPPLHWTLTERLAHRWEREYVWLDAPADAGVTAVSDGATTYAAQYDPTRGALAVCVDLAPGAVLTLTPADAAPATSLTVEAQAGVVVFRNAACAVALATETLVRDLGDRWELTGPLAWVMGSDGLPRAGSRLTVAKSRHIPFDRANIARVDPQAIAAEEIPPTVAVEVNARGPVFARYTYTVTMFDGRAYVWTATLFADHPLLYVEETAGLERAGALEIDVTRDFPSDVYIYDGVEDIRDQAFNPLPPAPFYLGSLAPHHTNHQLAYPWLGFGQSRRPQGTFRGIGENEVYPYADTLIFLAHHPWTWEYPGESTLRFEALEGRRAVARGAVARGTRAWCLVVLPRAALLTPYTYPFAGGTRSASILTVWHRKLNDLPLDAVRRMDLTSATPTPDAFPQALLTHAEYAEKAPLFAALAAELGDVLLRDDPGTCFARVFLQHDAAAAQKLAVALLDTYEYKLALVLHTGFLSDAMSAVANRNLGPLAVFFEACVALGALDAAQIDRLRTVMLLFAYASADQALFPSAQNYLSPDHPHSARNWLIMENYSDVFGTPNFQTDVYFNLALFAAVFHTHPQAVAWRDNATAQLRDQLSAHFFPGGVYKESIGYFGHLYHNMLALASVVKRHGGPDLFADPVMQGALETLVDYLGAPRAATVEHLVTGAGADVPRRYWPAIGDTGMNCTEAPVQPLLAHAAWEMRAHNPALAARALAAWRENGAPLWGPYFPQFEFVYLQALQPDVPPLAPTLHSRRFMHVGTLHRADVGRPSETSLFFRGGRATHHWGFDHGHITLISRGSLLIPDFGYYGKDTARDGATQPGYDTKVHNAVMFGAERQSGWSAERQGSERVVRFGDAVDYVVADLSYNRVRTTHWRDIHPVEHVEYFRHLLFARNRYLLVWDRIDFSIYPSWLRLNALASRITVDGPRVRFHGLDGVDLLVTFIAPDAPTFEEGLIGPMRYLLCGQPCERDYLWVAQPLGPGETPFTVTAADHAVHIDGVDLHGTAFADTLLYSKDDFPVTKQGRTLTGRLALLRKEGGADTVEVLDGDGVG